MRASFCRRLIALAAAYVVALEALLPGLALAAREPAAGVPELATICSNAPTPATSDGRLPVEHGTLCLHGVACLASGCGAAAVTGVPGPGRSIALGATRAVFASFLPRETDARHVVTPHVARAPPRA